MVFWSMRVANKKKCAVTVKATTSPAAFPVQKLRGDNKP